MIHNLWRVFKVIIFIYIVFIAFIRLTVYVAYLLGLVKFIVEIIGITIILILFTFRFLYFGWEHTTFSSILLKYKKWEANRKNNKLYNLWITLCYICVGKSIEYYDAYWSATYLRYLINRKIISRKHGLLKYCYRRIKIFFRPMVIIPITNYRVWKEFIREFKPYYVDKSLWFMVKIWLEISLPKAEDIRKYKLAMRPVYLYNKIRRRYAPLEETQSKIRFSFYYKKFRHVIFHYALIIVWFVPLKGTFFTKWHIFFYNFNAYVLNQFFRDWIFDLDLDRIHNPGSVMYSDVVSEYFLLGETNWSEPYTDCVPGKEIAILYKDVHGDTFYDLDKLYSKEEFEDYHMDLLDVTEEFAMEFSDFDDIVPVDLFMPVQPMNPIWNATHLDWYSLWNDGIYLSGYDEDTDDAINKISKTTLGAPEYPILRENPDPEVFSEYWPEEIIWLKSHMGIPPVDTLAFNINTAFLVMFIVFQLLISIFIFSRKMQHICFYYHDGEDEEDLVGDNNGKVDFEVWKDELLGLTFNNVPERHKEYDQGFNFLLIIFFGTFYQICKLQIHWDVIHFIIWCTGTKDFLYWIGAIWWITPPF